MQCDRARELVSGGLDGALGDAERAALAAHLAGCRECTAHQADLERMKHAVSALGREPAPLPLRLRIRDALAEAGRQDGDLAASVPRWQPRLSLPRVAAAIALACLVSSGLTAWLIGAGEARARLEHDVVSAHVRSLLDTPIQVASSDTHTVKPWFAGRVDVSPVVRDLAAEGFMLVGGRLDYVDGRRVAVVVYRQRQHVINVFTWSAAAARPPQAVVRNGYNLLTWAAGGVTYCAISDLNLGEMERLRSLL
ncbi:MAG: anti-sigma factor [Hyphomicrobiaceae bacterium]|nr:anti-sigma factor [Hyphomicrobiaceae bacterium]